MPDEIYGNPTWALVKLDSSIFHGFGNLSIYLIVLLIFSFMLVPYRNYLANISKWILNSNASKEKTNSNQLEKYERWVTNHYYIILMGIMLLSIMFAYLPSLPSVNPTGQPFGVDLHVYAERIDTSLVHNDFSTFVHGIFLNYSDKPLSYLFLLLFQKTFGLTALMATTHIFMILSPLLVFVTYKLVKFSFKNEKISLLSAFFTATSVYFIAGIYGGFLGNWMAIIITFSFLYFILNFWQSQSKKHLVLSFCLLVVLLFTHTFTWTYVILTIGLFLGWSFYYYRKDRTKIKTIIFIAIIIISTVGIDLSKTTFNGSLGGFEKDEILARETLSGNSFFSRWDNLTISIGIIFGGALQNVLPIFLTLVWLVNLKFRNDVHRLIGSFFFVVAPVLLFGDYIIQPRLLYMLPLNIGASMGVFMISTNLSDRRASTLFVAFIIIYQLNYVFRSILNFYFLPT